MFYNKSFLTHLLNIIYFKPNTLKALEAESLHGEEPTLNLGSHSSLAKLILGSWRVTCKTGVTLPTLWGFEED